MIFRAEKEAFIRIWLPGETELVVAAEGRGAALAGWLGHARLYQGCLA
jgi:hypothetical protein